jgi:sterol desaturase/sphingolipid hydroxylase (fatty acid hydroxylase superfamily)/rhodanese-related sulfurtransferase
MTENLRLYCFMGVLACLLLWESILPFFELFGHSRGARVRHLLRNLTIAALNAAVVSLGFVALWAWAAWYSEAHGIGVLHRLPVGAWSHAALAVLLLDGWTYCWHRLNHRVPLLWRFHRVHHSDAQMDVTTAGRFHFGEIALSSLLRVPLILLLGVRLPELVAYEALMFTVVQFHHANIGLPEWLDRLLRLVIVTPAMHKVHHSRVQHETDSNYTSLLSFWDRLFGTFRLRDDPRTIRFGLEGLDREADQALAGLIRTPFAGAGSAADTRLGRYVLFVVVGAILAAVTGVLVVRQAFATYWSTIKGRIAEEFPQVQQITTDELDRWISKPGAPPPRLLDVREPEEYAVSHLPMALRIDPDAHAGDLPPDIGKDATIVVYCSVGYRSAALAQRLQTAGFTNVRNLDGSIFKWANEGRPVLRNGREVRQVHPYDSKWGRLLDPPLRARIGS